MREAEVLEVEQVGVRFRRRWALRECSFRVREGTITALVGPNGAGKTTLMRAAAGLLVPTEGSMRIDGSAIRTSPAHPDLGYLPQDKPLYRQLTVGAMLDVGRNLNLRWDRALAETLCDDARLDRKAKIRTLSGGQRTRLALALVLARRPRLLLLDEPLADLDPLARLEVQQTLMTQVVDTGMTVLMSSHILGEVQDACDDLLLLTHGRVTLSGPIEDAVGRHVLLTGPGGDEAGVAALPAERIVEIRRSPRQITVLVDGRPERLPDGWTAQSATLEEVVVARLRDAATGSEAA